jgi:transcriptional regulator with XRE-family HTH domain
MTQPHLPPGRAIVQQLRAECAALGWSQRELARRADINHGVLHRYMSLDSDDQRSMTIDTLMHLCDVLGVPLSVVAQRAMDRKDD